MVFKRRFFSNSVCLDKFKEGYKKKGKKNEKSRKSESEDVVKEEPKGGDNTDFCGKSKEYFVTQKD